MANDKEIQNISIEQRNCRFPYEIQHISQEWYSFPRCLTQLRVEYELKNCNCTLHTAPEFCTYQ